jgi:hypothetical protein
MSQIWKTNSGSGPLPPEVATQYTTDVNGPAVPIANNLNVYGFSFADNDPEGIFTNGQTDTLYVGLSNRLYNSTPVSTVGAVTTPIITFAPSAGVGTYAIECRVAAYNTTSLLGAGYSLFGTVRFDGVNCNLCGTPDRITNEEGLMSAANATLTVSGGNIEISGVGYLGQTISWNAVGLYTYVG